MSGWHSAKLKEVFHRLGTEGIGLRQKEAEERLLKYSANEIQVGKKISPFRIFAEQFKSLLVIILIMAAILSYVIGIFPGQEARVVDSLLILLIVLAFAYKVLDEEEEKKENIENDLIFLGLRGMIDAPRRGVKKAIETCKRAGIRVVMITGDNKITGPILGGACQKRSKKDCD